MTATLTLPLIAVFAVLGLAKVLAVPAMQTAARHLGFTPDQYRAIGTLELAGAAGLALGYRWPGLGIAAAIGLALLLVGAAVAHWRNADPFARVAAPLVLAAAAAACAFVIG